MKKRISVSAAVVSLLATALVDAGSSPQTAIELDPPIECWYHDGFPQLDARLVPEEPVERARLYFRCSLYPDYYFVDLERSPNGGYRGVGPIAEESCPMVHYYVETLTVDYTAARSEERVADVTSHAECRRKFPAAALFSGDPDLFVGSTVSGAPSMAPGFKLAGVKGFLSAFNGQVATSTGSGISPAAAVGIGAAGAGAAAVIAVSSSSGEEASPGNSSGPTGAAPSSSSPAPTPPALPTAPGPTQALRACFDVDPPDATIDAGQSIRLDGRCSTGTSLSYRWELGDGRAPRDGAFITPTYPNPGVFTVTLTVSDSTGSSFGFGSDSVSKTVTVREPPPALTACFVAIPLTGGPNCEMKFDASCSVGDIVRYDWILDQGDAMGAGPYPDTGIVVVHNWNGYAGCNLLPPWTPISVVLTITARDGSRATTAQTVDVEALRATRPFAPDGIESETSFSSTLVAEGGEGRIHHNRRSTVTTPSGTPLWHRVRARSGTNEIEASLTAPLGSDGTWHFDFRGTADFVPGSIEVRSGQVVSSDAHSIVFRLKAGSGETVRLAYRLGR